MKSLHVVWCNWCFIANMGGCGWGGRVVVLGSSIPSLPKICMPKCPWARCWTPNCASQNNKVLLIDALYECVCDWVNVKLYCKELWVVIKTRKELYKYKSIYIKFWSTTGGNQAESMIDHRTSVSVLAPMVLYSLIADWYYITSHMHINYNHSHACASCVFTSC